jgi:hypothetical protein
MGSFAPCFHLQIDAEADGEYVSCQFRREAETFRRARRVEWPHSVPAAETA